MAPNYTAADAYAMGRSREGRNYALALISYYAAELNGRKGRDPEMFRPKSGIVATKVANMIRHLIVGDCDERGTAIKTAPVAQPAPVRVSRAVQSDKCGRCGYPLEADGRCIDPRHNTFGRF
jgi:hypothetical protein